MGWTRQTRRGLRHRPDVETLEVRTLLSSQPIPAVAGSASTSSSNNIAGIIGAAQTRSTYGVDGTGMTVAVIDTGMNYDNAAFGGGGFGPGHKVVAGYDFADNSPNPTAVQQHGTAVAGLIASDDRTNPGVAPGADIVDLRVFNNSGASSFSAVASALQWVINNHQQYNITAVNISLADTGNYQRNWFAQDGSVGQQVTNLVNQLATLNIPVITATGNSFNGQQGQSFPSIIPTTISVTATDSSDHLVSDAQRLGTTAGLTYATDLAAPGKGLTAPVDGNNFATVEGTSFAAPLVTGAVVLLQQIYEQRFGHLPSVNDLDQWLQQGADPVHDSATGITIGRLDIPGAAALIPGAPTSNTGSNNNQNNANTPPPTPPPVTTPPPTTTNTNPPPQSQTITPPASQTTTPPASTTTPPSNTPPPQTTPTQTTTPPATNVTVSLNGQVQDGTTNKSSGISSLLSLFSNIFRSSATSSGGSNTSNSSVKTVSIWGVSTTPASSPQPAGKVFLNTRHPSNGHLRKRPHQP